MGNLHKWAFAPAGTALLVVAPRWRSRVVPPVVSWQQEAGFPIRVEYRGTVDYTPWLAAPAGLFLLQSLGAELVRAHNAALAAWGQVTIASALGLDPAALPRPDERVSMRLVPLPAGIATTPADAVRLREAISDRLATEVAVGAWRGRGLLRLSAQVYNRAADYERLAAGLRTVMSGARAS